MTHDGSAGLVWLKGWRRTSGGLRVEAVMQQDEGSETILAPPALLLDEPRAFEPSLQSFAGLATDSVRIRVDDLSCMASVMRPGNLLGRRVPQAKQGRHAIFVALHEGFVAYLPASLLIRELWLWNRPALDALLVPNALDQYLARSRDADEPTVAVAEPLARSAGSDEGLRRLSWLGQCPNAWASWPSVLTHAHAGAINLRLPRVSLQAWGWGVTLPHGALVSELTSVELRFELPIEGGWMRIGQWTLRCPPQPSRRTGLVTY